ncbi:MAG: DUF4367 domain-containing protein [Lachnospiraceae bacterium]|nr:DUF4367 domain-containing protein [Lachnospiraceae bacterium]
MRTEDEKTDGIQKTEKQQPKSKVTPFRYPYRESDDPVIDAFILQGLQEEADEAEARMNSDPELSQINPPEDQYEQIVARLKAMGIWEEDEEEKEQEQTEEEREKEVTEARKEIAAANRKTGAEEREEELAETREEIVAASRKTKTEERKQELAEARKEIAAANRKTGLEEGAETELETEAEIETEVVGAEVPGSSDSGEGTSGKAVLGEDELYQMLSEKDREAIALGRRAQEKKKKRSRYMRMIVKRGGIVAAAFVLLIGVSMNVSASRQWIVQMWGAVTEVFATRTVTENIEESRAIESTIAESLAAMEEIEEITGIPGLYFSYWPEGMEYLEYEIFDEALEARVFYSYKDALVNIYMRNMRTDETSYYVSDEDSELMDSIEILEGIEVKVWEENPGQAGEYYRAEFAYEDYRYIISGALSLDEMNKLVKNMNFLFKSS